MSIEKLAAAPFRPPIGHDATYKSPGFRKGGYAPVFLHAGRAGIIGGKRKLHGLKTPDEFHQIL